MQNILSVNNKINAPQVLFGSDNINDFGNRVMTCMMDSDSMQPTIQPREIVAFVDCGGLILTSGIYVFTRLWIALVCSLSV